ncbi:MAG: hypothetical protein EBU04_00410 [Verrucomicrobia bacterium]|jgi:hypothetical protein|nr:hypothetical protein [Verrucomicrobiota bacterium]NBS03877.1 hypothetical protein [Verrucomicrobiota bacterium]NBY36358.1 hypothetical protein [Verrucomicrobiota bacterium]
MKHTLTALALASFSVSFAQSAAPAPVAVASHDLSLRGSFAWDSKNVYRGMERSSEEGLVQSALTLEYNVPGFSGVSVYGNFYNADTFERTYTFGAKTDSSFGSVDVGIQRSTAATAHTIAANGYSQLTSDREIYAGLTLSNANFKPSAYLYYSLDQKQYVLEFAGSKTFAGANVGLAGFDIETKAYAGFLNATKADKVAGEKNSYLYLGASADVTRAVGQGAKLGAGISYAYNTDGQPKTGGSSVWYRVFATFKF